MAIEPPDDDLSKTAQLNLQPPSDKPPQQDSPFERSRFGGSQRKSPRSVDHVPVSRSDLSKGPAELLEDSKVQISWSILLISSTVIIAFSMWVMLIPDGASLAMRMAVYWIAVNLGWYSY